MIYHCIENEFGVLVAIVLNTSQHLAHIVGTQMGIQSGLAGNSLKQLLLVILATEAQTDKVGSRQRACTLW